LQDTRTHTHLFALVCNIVKDGLECRVFKATVGASLLIFLISIAKSFGAKVKSIAKWLVDALQRVSLSHEDLVMGIVSLVAEEEEEKEVEVEEEEEEEKEKEKKDVLAQKRSSMLWGVSRQRWACWTL
jgi:cell shape-determining protein MreC